MITGCAEITELLKPTPVQDTEVIQGSFDNVWKATISALTEMGLPIKLIDKESGLITTEFVQLSRSEINDIASPPYFKHRWTEGKYTTYKPSWTEGKYNLNILATSSDENATKVKIVLHIEVFEPEEGWEICPSRRVIEKRIFDFIKARI